VNPQVENMKTENTSSEKDKVIDSTSKEKKQSKDKKNGEAIDVFKEQPTNDRPKIDTNDARFTRYGWWVIVIVFVIFGGWSATAKIDNAAVAVGEVVVASSNQNVQHLEGGLVSEVLVQEGDVVAKGQVLIRMSPTQAQAELLMVQGQLDEIYGQESRLRSEQLGLSELKWVDEINKLAETPEIEQIKSTQQAIFKARKEAQDGEVSIYSERINALKQQILGLNEYLVSLQSRIDSYKTELVDWEALFKEQFTDKIRLQEMKRQLAQLEGEYNQNVSEIARLKVQITENDYQKILSKQNVTKEVSSKLSEALAKKVDLSYRKLVLEDRLKRVDIVSPVDGKIKGLEMVAVGSVISAGETIMEIVPQNDQFAVKVRVSTSDIDKVKIGLITHIRFSAFNTQMTHVTEGEVVNISADKFVDEQSGMEYFEAKILVTEKGAEQMQKDGIYLSPGMPVEAMIKIGDRTLLGYLMKPFVDMIARSFNED
jgi:epimerase transport system membrane fusion protein